MNSGYVVNVGPFGETVDEAEQTGQRTTAGSWDWLAKPMENKTAVVAKDSPDQRSVDYLWGKVTWTTTVSEDRTTVTEEGRIHDREEDVTRRSAAEYVLVPSEGIGAVSDLGALYYIEQMFTSLDMSKRELDLRGLVDDLDVDQWGIGFAGRPVNDGGRKGALYGRNVEGDPDLGEELQQMPLSDVGFEHRYGAEKLKAYLAESGYVAAYGDDWVVYNFVPWLVDVVKPHVREEASDVDEDQSTLEEAADQGPEECDRCGRETDSVDETGYCVVCRDAQDEGVVSTGGD